MPFCTKLSEVLLNLDEEQKKNFISTAVEYGYDHFVDLRAEEIGLTRKQATIALVPVTFYGKKSTQVKQGTIVSTLDNRLYYLTETITLDENGVGEGICKAQNYGSLYNVKAKEICYLPVKYAGIISVENKELYQDAYDEESNEALYQRYLDKVRYNATSGNVYHYRQWCMSITGVGNCDVVPLWNGAGTVKCIIADSNNQCASDELIQKVKDYLDKEAPIGADVTVTTYTRGVLDVNAKVVLDGTVSLDDIITRYKNAIIEYLGTDAFETKYISYAKMIGLLVNLEGVDDCTDLTLNGKEKNILLKTDELYSLNNLSVIM